MAAALGGFVLSKYDSLFRALRASGMTDHEAVVWENFIQSFGADARQAWFCLPTSRGYLVGCGGILAPTSRAEPKATPPKPYYPDDWCKAEGIEDRLDISMHKSER